MALSGRMLNKDQRAALLGQITCPPDATAFLQSLSGYSDKLGDIAVFQKCACSTTHFVHIIPEQGNDSGNSNPGIEVLYQDQLRLQRERRGTRRSRYSTVSKNATEKGEELCVLATWDRIKPRFLFWIGDIWKAREEYDFVIYKSKEVEQRPAAARRRWLTTYNVEEDSENFIGLESAATAVLAASCIRPFVFSAWELPCLAHGFPSEANASVFRRHFKMMAPTLQGLVF
ncbi:hypothetical protein AK830_g5147 [Neonectria ditissima]|uniref:Uncharacterized protein n=1 Tax=Neonectria ditissima TaxID=78410 RepID=A0A0P7BJP8_9HYPO|nr:hypothetical protein AK830_g5147 [Neonectria ditissima]